MKPEQHAKKAERIERSLLKCSIEHYEIVIEGAMLAGTHWFNAKLHWMGYFPPDNDVMHAQYLSGIDRVKLLILQPEALRALDELESFRPGFVRGNMPGGTLAAERSLRLLLVLRTAAVS